MASKPEDSDSPEKKWLYNETRITNLPSVRDGISPDEELLRRQKAASFITEMTVRLNRNIRDGRFKILQNTTCTAMMYMHRFFTVHSMKRFDYRDISAACLYLAGKVGETPRRLEYIVNVWWNLKFMKQVQMDKIKYENACQLIKTLENCLLQTIGFDLTVENPHSSVLNAMDAFKIGRKVTQTAYWFATDILHITNWGIRFPTSTLACVCVHLACTWADVDLPENWFTTIESSLGQAEILRLTDEFMQIYSNCSEVLAIKKFSDRNGIIFDPKQQGLSREGGSVQRGAVSASPYVVHVDPKERKERPGTSGHGREPRKSFMPDLSSSSSRNRSRECSSCSSRPGSGKDGRSGHQKRPQDHREDFPRHQKRPKLSELLGTSSESLEDGEIK
ncbi:hypothetical protein L596_017988 [Steinernema carpocapsae]|uniref:Cyclin-like domain-containing protein n=1 Tax=Steinernema carpocapsae TaxID=34508 RepID=A0A4U5N3J4_STECR|nr:hypothetical protein L596_017988 [Steinernema carpocapsae]